MTKRKPIAEILTITGIFALIMLSMALIGSVGLWA